jgi:hypothetical protein
MELRKILSFFTFNLSLSHFICHFLLFSPVSCSLPAPIFLTFLIILPLSLLEMLMYTIGSAYFVAGSYPEGYASRGIYGSNHSTSSTGAGGGDGATSASDNAVYNPALSAAGMSMPVEPVQDSYRYTGNSQNYYDQNDMEGMSYNNKNKAPILWKSKKAGLEPVPLTDYDEETV